jgi:hypothetical protein
VESIFKNYLYIILSILLFSILATNSPFAQEPYITKRIEVISVDSIRKHVEFLGHDLLQGRGTGTRGEKIAGQYFASYLEKFYSKVNFKNETFSPPM